MRGHALSLIFLCLFLTATNFSQNVIESESRLSIVGSEVMVSLVVESDRDRSPLFSRIELLDTSDTVKSTRMKRDTVLKTGKQTMEFRLLTGSLAESMKDDITWYRVRYSIGDAQGIVSVSQLLRDLFELRIISSDNLFSGMSYRMRIRAVNPFSEVPAAGVAVEVNVSLDLKGEDDKKLELKGSGTTDVDGFSVIDFAIPPEAQLDDDGEIKVIGRKNGLVREAEEEINALKDDVQVLTMTDKPIYQPGQTLSIRGIVLKGAEAKIVVPASEIEFRITDDDDTLLYREKVMSSPFGIAAIGWQIPANVKLGNYRIEIRDGEGEQIGGQSVKVTRYDLPNFTVTAKPSKPYYLPADKQAEIEIKADYLFGKPVTKGKVRVVEETSREWNWEKQKYDIDEGEVREGETDATGKFIARFDLADTHEDLKDDDDDRFDDLKFAAYFTDPTTNKTEQRRFDVRVSREPIHVYLIRGNDFGRSRLPLNGYVSTFYPDGTPAQCDVQILASEEDEDKFKTYARIKTNSFGGGKFVMPRPNIGEPDDDLDFRIIARDRNARRGTLNDNIYFNDDEAVQVKTDRAIYKPGEMIDVSIESTVKTGTVYVDVVSGWSVLQSTFTALKDGKASIQIPYSDAFKGQLKIAAYVEDPEDDDDFLNSSTGVIFPAKQGISIDASFDKAVYKPNDEATVKFSVMDAADRAIESALGVVVFDKAVEERARTDAEFGGMFRNLGGWLGYGAGFGGVNVKDLNELDLTKPISADMQLVGELVLHDTYYSPNSFRSSNYVNEAMTVFEPLVKQKLQLVGTSLSDAYERRSFLHPVNDSSLNAILDVYGIDFTTLRDPWGEPYRTAYSVDRSRDVITIKSNGPDKSPDTKDDIIGLTSGFDYFVPMGRTIDAAINGYNSRNGGFIRDAKTLFTEMGIGQMTDRFGRPYSFVFDGDGRMLRLSVKSAGKDGRFEKYENYGDDFTVWTSSVDLFAAMERTVTRIQSALKVAPMNEAEFKATLKAKGVDFDQLKDGNGRPLFVVVDKRARYWDRVTIESVQNFGDDRRTERRIVTPVTQQIVQFTIKGPGRDGKPGNYDDISFAQYVHVLSEQSKDDPKPVPVMQPISFAGNDGAIAGRVTDANGASIPAATVNAINTTTNLTRTVTASAEGRFVISGLAAGVYTVRAEAANFKSTVINSVPVTAGSTASIDIILEVGSVSSEVTVTAGVEAVETSNSSISQNVTSQAILSLPLGTRSAMQLVALRPGVAKAVTRSGSSDDEDSTSQPTSTPRLREYFPETLLWQPEVITNPDGKAEVKFRMADNITTWKMYTIGSTKNGKIGFAEKEVAAFQSFFVDLDPPKFLTTGDEIFLPTQVRNYTEKKQNVNVTMSKSDWFGFLDGESKQVSVASGGSENAVFGFKALTPTKDGRQRVTAMGQTDSDAIERPVVVRPDGREIVQTDSKYFTGNARLDLNFPANALPNTQSAELKIYPNLMAHVAESVEGLLRRPYGCGEQTISSTYPNVMILKFTAPAEGKPRRISETVERKARKFIQKGYERLLGYQVADGGFSYWGGKDSADFALTAYALRFLADASAFVEVDPGVVKKAEDWLIRQQRTDGSWNKKYSWEEKEDAARAKATTTYVARTLAMLAKNSDASKTVLKKTDSAASTSALTKALQYLSSRNAEIDDPYSLALFGLAALDSGDQTLAASIAQRLTTLAKDENDGAYWNLESNTAFNGWGYTGRIETTALAAQLFIRLKTERELVGKAMIFLLKNKDRYGVWYSTQTTVNVLDAFVASMAAENGGVPQQVQVIVNGQIAQTVEIGPDKLDQITVALNGKLTSDKNEIELRSNERSPVMAQLVANHYISWQDADSSGRNVNQTRALRLDYKCDRSDAAIMQEISCSVEAERIGFRGYGMLLAEIGTPPGADVSRESLQAAMDADWSLSRYDILPDRVVLYMWSKAGGTKFNFKFKPRYGINAQTPASIVYDYYNPEAQATVAPLRFAVK